MSLDRRVRDGLERIASDIEPDVEGRLSSVLERRDRPRLLSFVPPIAVTAAAIVLVAVMGPALIGLLRGDIGTPSGTTPTPSPSLPSLAGTYATTVAPGDPAVDEHGLSGAWTIAFEADGVLSVTAPAEFGGTRTGYSYAVSGDQLETDFFGSDVCTTLLPGTYRWELVGDTLTLSVIVDPCAGRAALLAGQAWQAVTTAE